MHEYRQEMHREVLAGRDRHILTVGEMPGVTIDEARLFTDPARQELDMVFQFEHVGLDHGTGKFDPRPLRLRDLKESLGRWQAGLAGTGWNSLYWNNHDQPRIVSRFGDDGAYRERSAMMLATVLHLHRGTPYVYQGEELGMTNAPLLTIDDFRDIESLNYHAASVAGGALTADVVATMRAMSRDNARTPMQWDAGPGAGFTTAVPWLPVNPNHDVVNAVSQVDDPASVLSYYRRLIELRHSEPIIVHGDFTMLLPDDDRVYAFTRRLGSDALLVLGNFTAEEVTVTLPDVTVGEVLISNTDSPTFGVLRPWEAVVYRLS
jgi:oligo-1,6-glucosidase